MTLSFFFYLTIFIFGLAVGSFLNSIIYRLHAGERFLLKRSYCPYCKHILGWQDLIPILSFLALKGRCRYCQKPISWQYPLVELSTGLLLVSILWKSDFHNIYLLQDSIQVCYLLLISCFLIVIFVYDLKHYIIPDKIIYPAIGVVFLYNILYSYFILHDSHFVVNTLLAAILASVFFLAIVLVSRGKWMGIGDIKLAFLMGLFLGLPNILVALFLAFLIGAIIGIGLIILGKKTLKSEVPFGPFLVTGTFMALFWGERIVNWYLTFLIN